MKNLHCSAPLPWKILSFYHTPTWTMPSAAPCYVHPSPSPMLPFPTSNDAPNRRPPVSIAIDLHIADFFPADQDPHYHPLPPLLLAALYSMQLPVHKFFVRRPPIPWIHATSSSPFGIPFPFPARHEESLSSSLVRTVTS